MAGLTPLSFAQYVQGAIEAYNSGASQSGLPPANVGVNSALGPVFNAHALECTGLQWQQSYLASIARLLTTTTIADAATFVAPFGLTPNGAISSQGQVLFSTSSPAPSQLTISPGVIVQTADGTQFQVIADQNQPGWNPNIGAYVIPAGLSTVTATVQALIPGSAGNVLAQTINQIVSSQTQPAPAGISGVINNAGFTNGADAETVSQLAARFQAFIQGRWATDMAISSTVAGFQSSLTYSIGDQLNQVGREQDNFFTVVFNEYGQSTQPAPALISGVTQAVLANRPAGMPFQVIAPTLLSVSGTVTLQLAAGASPSAVISAAQTVWANYLNNIGLGNNIVYPSTVSSATTRASYNEIVSLLVAVPGVALIPDPPGLVLNGGTADIIAPWGTQIVAGSLSVTTQ